jgi:hypothetical protein
VRPQSSAGLRYVHADLQSAHRSMMQRYFDDGWSAGAVAKAFGRSPGFVSKLVRAERMLGRLRAKTGGSKDPRKRENRRPLSAMHCAIGVRVARYRRSQNINMTEFGLRVGLSRVRVGELEAGAYDFTLSNLFAISDELSIQLAELLSLRFVRRSRH